jgi:ligand-binding sensor domain-containing protein
LKIPWISKIVLCTTLLLLGACCPGPLSAPTHAPGTLLPETLGLPSPEAISTTPVSPSRPNFQKGLNYTAWAWGQFATLESDRSLENLAATGANWVAIVFFGYQEAYTSTVITQDPSRTPTDQEITHAIATAHDLGLKVMLKPHVDLRHDRDHWRGNIGEAFTEEEQWQAWFGSYGDFINHYAKLAQEHGVEQFCIGTELVGTSHREAEWREVVAGVREHFHGSITYAGNHGTEDVGITWWDAVDTIGIDAYYVLTDKTDPTLDELKAAWVEKGYVDTLAGLAERYDKPVLITEIGYRSADGTIKTPWDWDDLPLDLREQADAYRAALDVLWDQPWLTGIYWWNWDVNPQKGGSEDTDYTPYGKPAEEVLHAYYGGMPETTIRPTPYPKTAVKYLQLPEPVPASTHPGWASYTATGHVTDLAFDHDGNLWIATPGGLLKWDMASSEITRYTEADGLADNWVEKLAVAPNGELWIATGGGISRFDPSTSSGTPASGRSGHAWITYNKDNGLPCNGVTDITFTPNGDVWIGTFGCGIARLDGHTASGGTWTTFSEEDGLLERHALCITPTPGGALWIGTWKGASLFGPDSPSDDADTWTSFTTTRGLVHHGVEIITRDPGGAIWFGTWSGISRLNGSIWTSFESGDVGTWVESIAIAPDSAARTSARAEAWAATQKGIIRFNDVAWEWENVLPVENQPDERGPSITFAPDGSLWIGTYNDGIYHFDGENWSNYTLGGGLPSNKITAVALAPQGTVQIETRPDRYDQGGGTWQYDGHTWTRIAEGSLTGSDTPSTVVAPDGTVWGILDRGVSHFDGERWHTYTIENGLIDNDVRAVAIAPDGIVWIGTNGGLSSYTPPE